MNIHLSQSNVFMVEEISPNLAETFSKCNVETNNFGKIKKDRFIHEGFISSKLVYYHIYKAGGTTIQKLLTKLVQENKVNLDKFDKEKVNRDVIWWKYLLKSYDNNTEYLFNVIKPKLLNNKNIYKFSFVRDPIERFLSAFYEINRKHFDNPNYNPNKTGIQLLRRLIKRMKTDLENNKSIKTDIYRDWHLWPNYQFLSDENWKPIKFDYIGYSKNIDYDLPIILKPYLINDEQEQHDGIIMTKHRVRESSNSYRDINGNIEKVNNRFFINISMLTDLDIRNLCNLYWMDYKCFPFNIPKQCRQ